MRSWLLAASVVAMSLVGSAASAQNYPPTTTTSTSTTSTTSTTAPTTTTSTSVPGSTTSTSLGGTTSSSVPGSTTTAPGSTTTVPGEERPDVRQFGAVRPGESFVKQDCGFRPGATAELTFNDAPAGTATVEADGCVRIRVEVVTRDSVRIDGRTYATRCGNQTIEVIAPAPSGARRVAVNRFSIPCAEGAGLSRTGAEIARWAVVAVVLIGIGVFFLVADRRRARQAAVG